LSTRSGEDERERLFHIISMCLSVENRGINPFEVDVKKVLEILKKSLPNWSVFEDFTLDAEAINKISSIIHLQGGWIKHRSSSLYVDPLLIELKIRMMNIDGLAEVFMKSWHPIVGMEMVSQKRIKEAIDYWNLLLPIEDRLVNLPDTSIASGVTTVDELVKLKMIAEEPFNVVLDRLYNELKDVSKDKDKISYWTFIQGSSYEDTINRAYLTSFLVTYGYASMEINQVEEEVFLIPFNKPKNIQANKQVMSIPVSIDYDTWENIKAGKRT
jgi:hypothetical protein